MSKPKKDPVIGSCSYCGETRELEPDHVVPESLFFDKNQAKIIIPACRECNVEKSAGENDLRDFMVFSKGSQGHPTALKLIETIGKATLKGMSQLGKASQERRWEDHYTAAWVMVFYDGVCVLGHTGIELKDEDRVNQPTFQDILKRPGKREKYLRGIVDRRLVRPPPENLMGFLAACEERIKKAGRLIE